MKTYLKNLTFAQKKTNVHCVVVTNDERMG